MYLKKYHFKQIVNEAAGVDINKLQSEWSFTRLSANAASFSNGSSFYIVYVNTLVFRLDQGVARLNNDSYRTSTTKKWINLGLKYAGSDSYISQKNYNWYLVNKDGSVLPYENHMIINK